MDEKYLLVMEKIKKYNQEQLLSCYEKLDKEEQNKLLNQILEINLEEINTLYKNKNKTFNSENVKITPIDFIEKDKLTEEEKKKYESIGIEIIKNGEYAVITMAGGQRNKTWT